MVTRDVDELIVEETAPRFDQVAGLFALPEIADHRGKEKAAGLYPSGTEIGMKTSSVTFLAIGIILCY